MKIHFALLIISAVLSSCSPSVIYEPILPTDAPTATNAPRPTDVTRPTNTTRPTITPEPVTVGSDLDTIAFGYDLELFLSYDKNTWESVDNSGAFKAIRLINAPDCSMSQNFGRGAPEWWERVTTQELIGDYDFRVEQWTDTQTNQVVLVTYNIDKKDISIAIEPGSDPSACMDAAWEVIVTSVMNNFGQFN